MTCPLCGAPLVRRKGKYGEFLGCAEYPRCTYTQKAGMTKKEAESKRLERQADAILARHGIGRDGV